MFRQGKKPILKKNKEKKPLKKRLKRQSEDIDGNYDHDELFNDGIYGDD